MRHSIVIFAEVNVLSRISYCAQDAATVKVEVGFFTRIAFRTGLKNITEKDVHIAEKQIQALTKLT